jgi:hypothetical protein
MATWIGHLRVAEKLFEAIPGFDETAFTFGSLAPDSGKPNADWSAFDPPKEVTHFLHQGADEDKIHDLTFYRDYVSQVSPETGAAYSFVWAYFFHLLCDNLWTRLVWDTTKTEWAARLAEDRKFGWMIKKDWYGLDHHYLRDHVDCSFWRVFAVTPNAPAYLPFLSEEAMHHSLNYIRDGYLNPSPERFVERPYLFLNAGSMNRYVDESVAIIHQIYNLLQDQPNLDGKYSSLALLTTPLTPFPAPLGDSVEEF